VSTINLQLTIITINLALTSILVAMFIYFLSLEQPEVPDINEIIGKLKMGDGAVLAGRNRLNKKIDNIMGSYMLEQFPIAQLVMDRVPALGEIMVKNPETISYIQLKANEYLGKLGQNLPGDIGGFLEKLIGANLGELLPQTDTKLE